MEELLSYVHFVLLPQMIDALIIGAALALVALGLTMIFGLLDVINLAHTGLMAVGVYAAVTASNRGYRFWIAALAGALAAGLLGAIIERLVVRRSQHAPLCEPAACPAEHQLQPAGPLVSHQRPGDDR